MYSLWRAPDSHFEKDNEIAEIDIRVRVNGDGHS